MAQCKYCMKEIYDLVECPKCHNINDEGIMVDMFGHEIKVKDYLKEGKDENSNTDTCGW